MTMRKNHNKRNLYIEMGLRMTPQLQLTLDWQAKLLGIGADPNEMINKITRKAAKKVEPEAVEMTAEDHFRIAKAAGRRAVQGTKRARNYARCVMGNRALTNPPNMDGVRVANKVWVDGLFLAQNIV